MTVRPTVLEKFIGQTPVVDNLSIAVISAKRQSRQLGHVLLTGPAGVGKTTLAMSVLPVSLGTSCRFLNCASVEKPQDLTVVLSSIGPGQLLFLDELHALIPAAREHLLTAMEDRKICVRIDDQKIMEVDLPAFTVIGATTRVGLLDGPLRTRFQHKFTLTTYSQEETEQIIDWHATSRNFRIGPRSAAVLARAAQGIAREAVNLLEAAVDTHVSQGKDGNGLLHEVAQATVDRLGYKDGLSADQQRYLAAVRNRSIGLKQLATILNEQPRTIEEVIEPWLLQNGLIEITASGRQLKA